MALKHAYQSPTANNPAEEVSSTRWNEAHTIDDEGIVIPAKTTTEAATPAAGNITIYSKNIAGRVFPKWVGPSGVDTPFQPFLGGNRIILVGPGSATTAAAHANITGGGFTSVGATFTQISIGTGSQLLRLRRWTQATNTTAGNVTSHRSSLPECSRETGFFLVARFHLSAMVAGQRGFFGLNSRVTAPANADPVAATAVTDAQIGIGFNTNTGNWKLVNNTASTIPTVTDLGASFPLNVTDPIEIVFFCAPNGASVGYRITNMTSNVQVSGTISTNLPALTQGLGAQYWMTNNATAAACGFGFSRWYLETDY